MRAKQFTEAALGTTSKRPLRPGSRPERGHEPQKRYVTDRKTGKQYDPEEEFNKTMNSPEVMAQMKRMATKEGTMNSAAEDAILADESWEAINEWLIQERGKASRSLCLGSTPDEDLGASQLASCKSQGLRARDGEKSHLIGHGSAKARIKVGGKKIKGKKYGGPLPDYGTRKGQK